jgi:hypothetical protein
VDESSDPEPSNSPASLVIPPMTNELVVSLQA